MNVLRAPITAAVLLHAICAYSAAAQGDALHDVSGLAWIAADSFLVVHDAKYPDEVDRRRAGIITLPTETTSISYAPLEVVCDCRGGPIHDLESISRVPGTRRFLIAESGDDGTSSQRMYLSELTDGKLHVLKAAAWPVAVRNVEGMAVAKLDQEYVIIFAERAHGRTATEIRYARMDAETLTFEELQSVTFETNLSDHPNLRPVSALEVDTSGRIFGASAVDPNREVGPFSSHVWEIGIIHDSDHPTVTLSGRRIATLDGVKVEGLAVRDLGAGELFVGTDDEGYGAIVRPLHE